MSNKILRSLAIMGSVILFFIAFYFYYDYLINELFATQPENDYPVTGAAMLEFICLALASVLMYKGLSKVYKKFFLIIGVIIGFIALSFLIYPLINGIGATFLMKGRAVFTVLLSIFMFIIGIKFISDGLD